MYITMRVVTADYCGSEVRYRIILPKKQNGIIGTLQIRNRVCFLIMLLYP